MEQVSYLKQKENQMEFKFEFVAVGQTFVKRSRQIIHFLQQLWHHGICHDLLWYWLLGMK